tara:strand:+ start:18 stop:854 length:837 start_codon:yes stop_codon:yes gene_type:complete
MTLWNPIYFLKINNDIYYIKKYFKNFLSSYSDKIDSYIKSNINNINIEHYLTTSLSSSLFLDIDYKNNNKLFYIGTNWEIIEEISNKKINNFNNFNDKYKILSYLNKLNLTNNHKLKLLFYLDRENLINIYGKKKLYEIFNMKINVFDLYNNYCGEIAFDNFSILNKIKESGIGLVLHNKAHKNSDIISMRTFECIVAGVPIIADKNLFLEKFFNNNIFYIDIHNDSIEKTINNINNYINFINDEKNKNIVINKINNTREIFVKYFCFKKQIYNLVHN